jgi:ELWxxDGT repeat protein
LLKNINAGAAGIAFDNEGSAAIIGSTIYFTANDTTHGIELWKTDGTEAGTVLVKDINTADSSTPFLLGSVGNTLFFTANDTTHGYELWKTDGTEVGTVLVKDINPLGDSNIIGGKSWSIGAAGNRIVFQANDGVHGREPWTSDGTAAGTVMIEDINPSGNSNPGSFQSFGNVIIFTTRDPDTDFYTMWEY